jgi:hypothetical protein
MALSATRCSMPDLKTSATLSKVLVAGEAGAKRRSFGAVSFYLLDLFLTLPPVLSSCAWLKD